ncbi:hypothetical protein CANARDRAFT_28034, partial [[Candida] arabinofermentans NRRL YB-2248]
MDITSSFRDASVNSSSNLNWVFLVDWALMVIGGLGILFYFNRALAVLLSFILKYAIWKDTKVRIKFQSVKVSLLGGRIFFKNLTIITENNMILIHQGWFTWRYWLSSVRRSGLQLTSEIDTIKNSKLPTRFLLEAYGLEVFMYNRTPVFESILESLKKQDANLSNNKDFEQFLNHRTQQSTTTGSLSSTHSSSSASKESDGDACKEKTVPTELTKQPQSNLMKSFLDMMPISVEVKKGSFVIGNDRTLSLFVASYSSLKGSIDTQIPRSTFDMFSMVHNFRASQLQIFLKPNVTYKSIDQVTAEMERRLMNSQTGLLKRFIASFDKNVGRKPKQKQKKMDDGHEDDNEEWHGLERYLTGTTRANLSDSSSDSSFDSDDKPGSTSLVFEKSEYARYTHILDTDYVDIHYSYDIPDCVPAGNLLTEPIYGPDIGNGSSPPENGIDISISGGIVYYGPWADKERAYLHAMLFPTICRDAKPFTKLTSGMLRQYVGFKLYVEALDELTLRVPFREFSKDILFANLSDELPSSGPRSFAWLDVKVDKGSVINTSSSYIPTVEDGWKNTLEITFLNPEVTSSVNHNLFFKAKSHTVNASIGYPLKWNGETHWSFKMESQDTELYLVREHITLFTDLFGDFSSGDPTPYELFRPFLYTIDWDINNYTIFLNLNERNIVNNPLDFNENIYISFQGSCLNLKLDIPLDAIYKKSNTFNYKLSTSYFDLILDLPPWNTGYNFMKKKKLGESNNFVMQGSYTYFNAIEIDSIDTIILDCTCDDTTLECYGFLIRYVLMLKANYFGEFLHFQTLPEFIEGFRAGVVQTPVSTEDILGVKVRNETDLLFTFCVNNGCLILPSHIYDCESHLALHFDSLDIDLRFNNYYMDMQANFSQITTRFLDSCDESLIYETTRRKQSFEPELLVDGFTVHGHRMFGLPPDEPTYYCRWEFDAGDIIVDCQPFFIDALKISVAAIGVGYVDAENTLGIPIDIISDIVNLTFNTPKIEVKLNGDNYYLKAVLNELSFKLSDQATLNYNSRIDLNIEKIQVTAVQDSILIMDLETSLRFTDFVQKPLCQEKRAAQIKHIKLNDGPFHRCPFLLPEEERDSTYQRAFGSIKPFIPFPDVPPPITDDSLDLLLSEYPQQLQEALEDMENSDTSSLDDHDGYVKKSSPVHKEVMNLDDDCEYDNLVLNFGTLKAFISPVTALVLVDIKKRMKNLDIYTVMDSIQNGVITHMNLRMVKKAETINIKFDSPLISIKVAELIDSNDYLNIEILKPSIAASFKTSITKEESIALHSSLAQLDIELMKDNSHQLLAIVQGLEVGLLDNPSDTEFTVNKQQLSVDVDPKNVGWASEFVENLMVPFKEADRIFDSFKNDERNAKIELVYAASVAGVQHAIGHDPSCITKPTYISKFMDDHIRFQDSWKIAIRLRHVINSLPESWKDECNARFKSSKWEAPPSAKGRVLDIFENWRRWEFETIVDSYIFNEVFDLKDKAHSEKLVAFIINVSHLRLNVYPFENLIQFRKIELGFHSRSLAPDLKDMATSLMDKDVDHGVEVDLRIGAFVMDITRARVFTVTIVEILQDFSEKYSTRKVTDTELSTTTNESLISEKAGDRITEASLKAVDTKASYFSVNILVDEFEHTLGIERSSLKLYGRNSSISLFGIKLFDLMPFTLSMKNDAFHGDLLIESTKLIALQLLNHSIGIANTGSLISGDKRLDMSVGVASLNAILGTAKYVKAIDIFVKNEYPIIKPLIEEILHMSSKPADASDLPAQSISSSQFFDKIRSKINGTIFVQKILINLELMSPLLYELAFQDSGYDFSVSRTGIVGTCSILRVGSSLASNLKRNRMQYFLGSLEKLNCLLGLTSGDDHEYKVMLKIHADHCRLNISQFNLVVLMKRAYSDSKTVTRNLKLLEKAIESVNQLFSSIKPIDAGVVHSDPQNEGTCTKALWETVKLRLHASLDTFTFVSLISGRQVILDSSNFTVNLNTFDPLALAYKPYGEMNIPSAKLSFGMHGSQSSRFTVCDVNLRLKVSNFVNAHDLLQKLEISSDFCRLVLTPYFTKEIIGIVFDIQRTISTFNIEPTPTADSASPTDTFKTIMSFFSIRIVSKNLCIGWLFPNTGNSLHMTKNNIPGFIIGYESAEFICAKRAGKILVTGLYVSTAHGDSPSTYYAVSDESTSNSRAYFPLFELVYTVGENETGGRMLKAKLLGDKIDVKFQTSVFSVTESLLSSIASVQEKFDDVYQLPSKEVNSSAQAVSSKSMKTEADTDILSSISAKSVACMFKFDGASIMIMNEELEVNGEIPYFALQAPTIELAIKYSRCFTGPKKHIISVEALTSATDNLITSSCVPVIVDLIRSSRFFMRSVQYDRRKSVVVQPTQAELRQGQQQEQLSFDLERVFENIKVNFSLNIEPQRLTLSCDPTAKIEATVSTNGIRIMFNTDNDSVSGLVYVEDVKTELQHVYSKETSGAITFQDIILSATLASVDGRKRATTVAKIASIDAFLNVQQRQDLDLFRDIWIPGELYEDSVAVKQDNTMVHSTKSFAEHMRDVSLTAAYPWILSLLITKAMVRIDLGMSLGVLNVGFDGFWATSTKAVNWDQNVKLEFNKFSMFSDGRLGGVCTVEKIRMASAISWKKDTGVLDIPLVLLTAGFGSLEAKLSLDFHTFFVVDIKKAAVTIYNQRVENRPDKLVGKTSVESCSIYMTAMAASNFVDIYTIGLRIRQEIKISYHQVLNDSVVDRSSHYFTNSESRFSSVSLPKVKRSADDHPPAFTRASETFLDVIEKLRSDLDVKLGFLHIQIFPSSLLDSQALVIRIGSLKAKFIQDMSTKIENRLKLDMDDIAVSLSTLKNKVTEASLDSNSIESFVKLANSATGGSIFVFPSLHISMDMWQHYNSNLIEYTYTSSFGGKVDVGWKLGSVYFIREMWYSHATTLKSRLTALRIFTSEYELEEEDAFEENYKESIFESVNLEDKLKDYESDKKYEYVPLVEPHIEAPQLKDLGSATPPLEWFGLHRAKFPNLTHQFVIVSLQKLVKEAEIRYSKVL